MTQSSPLLIYGAYGFTGKLIVAEAVRRGLRPVIAGRNRDKTEALARQYDLEYRVFSLDDGLALRDALKEVKVILQCAGPFIHTVRPVLEACLTTQTHYVDITGEIEVFEYLAAQSGRAASRGIVLLPGSGFDVVPSDCLAAHLKSLLPDAHTLTLAFKGVSRMSRGTALTMVENLGKGGAIRRDGKIVEVPAAHEVMTMDFGDGEMSTAARIPWGDVSTAYYSTGIPNIQVFMALPKPMIEQMRQAYRWRWLLKLSIVKNYLKKQAEKRYTGPDDKLLKEGKSYLWGRVENKEGQRREARLITPEGYRLTSLTAVEIARRLLEPHQMKGFYTPSKAFGKDFILEFEGVERTDLGAVPLS
ncbi:MAG: saccharopine dehydrogenase [Thermonema sp.]|uniref:saccharopine dehydrogenase family protein n=1 Tax=Thermonema sp. TaxID=2231181 RepID=UPI0021DCFE2C|nr:saccharopine dehydrogenase NADP-binding domain-containing protein [Thermonema sp.]GIV40688.1 MAG: saccharopine dehydrogenase [Thermonema sp.]